VTNDVWVFGRKNEKVVLLGRRGGDGIPADPVAPGVTVPGAQSVPPGSDGPGYAELNGHVLRTYDGMAQRCDTCGAVGLVKGEICDMIGLYNETR
jgi:hypothetical protein